MTTKASLWYCNHPTTYPCTAAQPCNFSKSHQHQQISDRYLHIQSLHSDAYKYRLFTRTLRISLTVSVSHSPCTAVDILLQCVLVLVFLSTSVIVCHALFAWQLVVLLQSIVPHCLSMLFSVYRVNTFPQFLPRSVTAITSPSLLLFQCPYLANFRFFSCSSSPFCSGTPIFCRTQTLVLYSVQLIRSTRLQHHNSNAVIRFSSHFFTAQLSDPYNAMLHTNDLTNCFFSFRLISADFHISVSCLMTCRAIANRTFISVELLLSLVTIDPKNLNLSTRPIALPATVITCWSTLRMWNLIPVQAITTDSVNTFCVLQ